MPRTTSAGNSAITGGAPRSPGSNHVPVPTSSSANTSFNSYTGQLAVTVQQQENGSSSTAKWTDGMLIHFFFVLFFSKCLHHILG